MSIRPGHPETKKTNKTNKTNSELVLRPYLRGHNTSSGLVLLVLLVFLVPGAPDHPVPASLCWPRTLFRASPACAAHAHVFRTLSADPGSAKPSSAEPEVKLVRKTNHYGPNPQENPRKTNSSDPQPEENLRKTHNYGVKLQENLRRTKNVHSPGTALNSPCWI